MRPILIGLALLGLGFTPALVGASLAAPPAHAGKGDDNRHGGKPDDRHSGKPDDKHSGKPDRGAKDDKANRGDKDDLTAERVLTGIEQAILRDYFGTDDTAGKGHKGLPPGLAKRETLPPGLEKQLERNGRLPPGLDGRALPEDLERRLPRRNGTRRVVVGDDVVLIEEGTRVILDILRGAAGGR